MISRKIRSSGRMLWKRSSLTEKGYSRTILACIFDVFLRVVYRLGGADGSARETRKRNHTIIYWFSKLQHIGTKCK
jgi:hypothetical protein